MECLESHEADTHATVRSRAMKLAAGNNVDMADTCCGRQQVESPAPYLRDDGLPDFLVEVVGQSIAEDGKVGCLERDKRKEEEWERHIFLRNMCYTCARKRR